LGGKAIFIISSVLGLPAKDFIIKQRALLFSKELYYHSTAGGTVKCWGVTEYGQLGNSTMFNSDVPVEASNFIYGVAGLALGYGHTCAITDAGGVQCWGLNANGQIGSGSTPDAFLPVDVVELTGG
jgi:alpha-tubulin suppressor-like RCC1 family protein